MNPFLLRFADGSSFLAGTIMVIAGALPPLWLRNRLACGVSSTILLLGMALALLSSTPLPVLVYVLWVCLALAVLVAINLPGTSRLSRRAEFLAAGLLVAATLVLLALELSHRLTPRIDLAPGEPIFVIGDSLSSGLGSGEKCWPAVLGEALRLPVTNLAVGGAKVRDACYQAARIPRDRAVVVVEIGGNDVLNKPDARLFRESLDKLLADLHQHQHRVLMFELPLPPLYGEFARAQRQLAARYDVTLIPKWCLAHVLGAPNATVDGLHLSQARHNHLAQLVSGYLRVDHAQAPARRN